MATETSSATFSLAKHRPHPQRRGLENGQGRRSVRSGTKTQRMNMTEYESVINNAPIGICLSKQRKIVFCNFQMANLFRYKPQDLIEKSFSVLYPSTKEFERNGAQILVEIGKYGKYQDERIMRRIDGELFWCHVIGASFESDESYDCIWTFTEMDASRKVPQQLTPRERQIASMLVQGKTSKAMALQVGLSPRTVEYYRERLMRKVNAGNVRELIFRLTVGLNQLENQ
jgi:PAS domain S-box-containing protein